MKCPKCEKETNDDLKFCSNCGYDLTNEKPSKLSNIVLIIVLLINTFFLFYSMFTRNTFLLIMILMIYIYTLIITLSDSLILKIVSGIICALILSYFAYIYFLLLSCESDSIDLLKGCE